MPLQKEIKTRIRKESIEYAPTDMNLKLAYQAGATTEAERAGKLVEAVKSSLQIMEDGYRHVAKERLDKALNEYLHPETKKS
jgi:hypothetical protein